VYAAVNSSAGGGGAVNLALASTGTYTILVHDWQYTTQSFGLTTHLQCANMPAQ